MTYGLVERLRNGGQTDLADMAQELVDALHKLCEAADDSDGSCYGTLSTRFVRDLAEPALKKAGAA